MEQDMNDKEQPESHQQYEMTGSGLGDILGSASFQPHHDLELMDSPKPVPSLECVSGQSQAVLSSLGRISHHLMGTKEETNKVKKRQKTSNGALTPACFSSPFSQQVNGQELHSSAIDQGYHRDRTHLSRTPNRLSVVYSSPFEYNQQRLEAPETIAMEYNPSNSTQWSGRAGNSSCGSRVTGLYAELIKELELQLCELQKLLASREEASVQQNRRIKQLELENQQLKSQLRSLEEQNDLLSSRSTEDCGASGRLLLDSRHSSVDITENNLQFLKALVGYLERSGVTQVNGAQPLPLLLSRREPKYLPADVREPPILPPSADVREPPILPPPADVREPPILPPPADVREPPILPPPADVREPPILPPPAHVREPPILPPPAHVQEPPILPPPAHVQESMIQPIDADVREPLRLPPPTHVRESSPIGMLRVIGVTSGFQYWMNAEDSSGSPAALNDSSGIWDEPIQDTLPDGTPAWASPVEENGRPKLELIPNSGVYITHHQLDDLSHISTDKPKLMTRRLLGYFFSRETLARSSATGQRIAHNNTTMEKPIRLPIAVVNVIKEYVTKVCGRGCNFNAVINSKCGTSRRAVKKMSIRIDWMEGGQRCSSGMAGPKGSLYP
ncbi:cyclin-dependent kinase 12-like [Rhinatrema bivittatum]|uniref:cyclin-dependent kinase 12-like n=1 Tax=Rhinatrema bivittatum TaxID=194408 RepID=UPI00112AA467|nr:cyclin-dependent kinase 12-like [Rhinatrema bivittatum]XP_029428438.1 cyclin-dependent kinase 12-like [Rhinatrema bivittatum]